LYLEFTTIKTFFCTPICSPRIDNKVEYYIIGLLKTNRGHRIGTLVGSHYIVSDTFYNLAVLYVISEYTTESRTRKINTLRRKTPIRVSYTYIYIYYDNNLY